MKLTRRSRLLLASVSLSVLASTSCSDLPAILITSPTHGEFTTAATTAVSGVVINVDPDDAAVTVNGVAVAVDGTGAFDTTITLDPAIVSSSSSRLHDARPR